jgi:sporulation protein YlmC with PRC-barrel domain
MSFLSLAFAFSWAAAAVAEDPTPQAGQPNLKVAHVMPSSDITGINVLNKQGEKLGTINDLVIDLKTGEVRYAALSHGGVAGIGAKLFAVPFQAMQFVFGKPNDSNDRHFVLDATKEHFDNAKGFDSSHWPNVADPKWGETVDKQFNYHRDSTTTQTRSDANRSGAVDYETVFRCSQIKGMDVRNSANEDLGDVSDVAIDVAAGKAKYLALSYGSWFTGGNKLFAVPMSAFTINHANNKTFFTVHVSQDALKAAPGFDKDHWPNAADPNWTREIDSYYERTAQRKPADTTPNR